MKLSRYLPSLEWIRGYKKEYLRGDLSAGLTVGVMLIPQGMAYSMLAGLPPIYGLYASIVPLILYAFLGTSRQLAVGPVAMVALLIASGIGAMADLGSPEFVGLAILTAFMVGVMQLMLGVLRMGFLVNFLSHPVISGFTSAAALIIGLSQLKHLTGLDIPRGKVHETLGHFFTQFGDIHWLTAAVGGGAIIILLLIKKKAPKIPGPLVVVGLTTILVASLGWADSGVKIVGDVPSGLPVPSFDFFSPERFMDVLPTALVISLVGFMESIAVAKAIQAKHKDYQVDANQELIGLGAANIGGALFQAFPTTGGFSRTAVNDQAGARTGFASIISAVLIALTLLFLTDYFYYMPKAVLASIIMVAVFGLIDIKEAKHLWKTDKVDFVMLAVTFIFTLALGIEEGIGIGVVLSLVVLIYRAAYPHIAVLGKVPGTDLFRNRNRFQVEDDPTKVILRLDSPLWFANTSYVKDKVDALVEEKKDTVKEVIFKASSMSYIDSTGVHMIHDLHDELEKQGVVLKISGAIGPVRDVFEKTGMVEDLGAENIIPELDRSVQQYELEQHRLPTGRK